MRIVRLALLLVAALAMAGCPKSEKNLVYGTPGPDYQSIVSLSPSSTEVVARWCAYQKLKGRTAADKWPNYVTGATVVVDSTKPDYEKILSLKADLVVYDPLLYSDAEIAKIKELKIETFVWDPKNIDEMIDLLYKIGAMTRSELNCSGYVDKIIAARAEATSQALSPMPRVALVLPGVGSEHMIVGTNSFQADQLKASGGEPVGPASDRFVPLNPEELITLNPDAIIVAGDAAPILNDPKLQSIKAIQTKRVLGLAADACLRRGGRVDQFIIAAGKFLRTK